ncbi:MAG: DUF6152 family protein [Paracoccaceae bacterium]|nr:DUF6152 family protein [Paracoccaceae bacterium]
MILTRRAALAGLLALPAFPALAHHGWRWTAEGKFELRGVIRSAELGNPHGLLTIAANDELWTAEVGQPWRNERAGLDDAMMAPGTEITVIGARAADPERLVMKAEILVIDGMRYILYPDRV